MKNKAHFYGCISQRVEGKERLFPTTPVRWFFLEVWISALKLKTLRNNGIKYSYEDQVQRFMSCYCSFLLGFETNMPHFLEKGFSKMNLTDFSLVQHSKQGCKNQEKLSQNNTDNILDQKDLSYMDFGLICDEIYGS